MSKSKGLRKRNKQPRIFVVDRGFITWPPDRMKAKISFSIGGSVTTTTSLGEIVLSGNNVNDPGLSFSATQPVWYDQLQVFYLRYRVHASKIEVNTCNTTALVPYSIAVYPTTSSAGVTNLVDACSQPRCKVRQGSGANGNDRVRIVHSCDSSKIFGTPITASTDFSGLANANPGIEWYWVVSSQAFDGTTSVTITDEIRLVYDVEFYDRAFANASTFVRLRQQYKRFALDFRDNVPQHYRRSRYFSSEPDFEAC